VGAADALEQLPQARCTVFGMRLIARLHLDVQYQAQIGDEVGMVGVQGTPRLVRVVAQYRPFLMAVDRLDGHIGVENPRLAEQRLGDGQQMALQPGYPLGLLDPEQCGPYRILADNLLHTQ